MSNTVARAFLALALLLLFAACSVTKEVRTEPSEEAARKLKAVSKEVRSVKFLFTRPDLTCEVRMRKEPTERELQLLLEQVKAFATISHMEAIAASVKWDLEISEFHFTVYTNSSGKSPFHHSYARYFQSFDTTDTAPANIDGYQTWIDASAKPRLN